MKETARGSPEECSSADHGEAAIAAVPKDEDPVAPQGIASTPIFTLGLEDTSGAPEECSCGKRMAAAEPKDGDDTDSSYVFVDHTESDGTEGDVHVIGEVVDPGEVVSEVKDNWMQNSDLVPEDFDENSPPSPLVEGDEAEMRKTFENDILMQVIGAAEVENKSRLELTMDGQLHTDSIHIEQHANDLCSFSKFEVTNVADGNNDFADSISEKISQVVAEVVRIEDEENVLLCTKNTNESTLITAETFPSGDEKTIPGVVKSSLGNGGISKTPALDFLHDRNDSMPSVDYHEYKCDDNVGSRSADSIANIEAYTESQSELGTCEAVMDYSDPEQPEDGNDDVVKVNNKENGLKEAVGDSENVASSVDYCSYLVASTKFYMVRVPRILDYKLSEQIDCAQRKLEEKTHQRDSIRKELQNKKAICSEYGNDFNNSKAEEKAAYLAFSTKRKEIEELKSTMSHINVQGHIDDVIEEIQHLERKMQHETMSLKEEKLLLRRIKELKQSHASLSLKLGTNSELHLTLEEKTQIEGKMKHLSSELETLRGKLFQAKKRTDTSKKKCDEGYNNLRELQGQHKVADDHCQQAYMNLRNLKKELSLKNRHFYKYKDELNVAASYASTGKLNALQKHCIEQVEMIMELWNKNDEFRRSYVQSIQFSTIRRFKTLDGRSLGPDEEPATLPTIGGKSTINSSVPLEVKTIPYVESTHENVGETLVLNVDCSSQNVVQKKITESNKEFMPKLEVTSALAVVKQNEERVAKLNDENVPTTTSDEVAKEELLKQDAKELKAKIIAEQKAKREEAEERKRRKVERAKAFADIRARREAELREKKKAKKRNENTTPCSNDATRIANNIESSSACKTEVAEAAEGKQIVSGKPSTFSSLSKSHYKVKPLPPPLRYKGKRKSHTLIWVLLLVVPVILFWVGYYFTLYH